MISPQVHVLPDPMYIRNGDWKDAWNYAIRKPLLWQDLHNGGRQTQRSQQFDQTQAIVRRPCLSKHSPRRQWIVEETMGIIISHTNWYKTG